MNQCLYVSYMDDDDDDDVCVIAATTVLVLFRLLLVVFGMDLMLFVPQSPHFLMCVRVCLLFTFDNLFTIIRTW